MSGQYDIWTGSYNGQFETAELQISEVRT